MLKLLKRYWLVLAAGVLASWTAYALINPALHLQRSYERQADADTAYYTEKAQSEYARDCLLMAAPAKDKCRYEKTQAAREGQHDANDLKAQLVSSAWTRQMGIAAILGVVLSIVGIVLVWITFRATREANDISKSESRPYLLFAQPKLMQVSTAGPTWDLSYVWELRFRLINSGQRPALITACRFGKEYLKQPPPDYDAVTLYDAQYPDAIGRDGDVVVRVGLSSSMLWKGQDMPKRGWAAFLVKISYRGIGDDVEYRSEQGRLAVFDMTFGPDQQTKVIDTAIADSHRYDHTS